MKNKIKIGMLLALTAQLQANPISSHTFFSIRPEFQTGSPERETLLRDPFIIDNDRRGVFELVPIVGHSANSNKLAEYFLPFGKSEILVAEDNSLYASQRDVSAAQLNINNSTLTNPLGNTFASRSKFEFERSVMGIGFGYRCRLFNHNGHGMWFAISSPFEIVRNNVTIHEHIIEPSGNPVGVGPLLTQDNFGQSDEEQIDPISVSSVTLAFMQQTWEFGRVDQCAHEKIGLADIDFQFGYAWHDVHCHAELYLGATIPTGNKPKACLLFEPIIGNNKHGAILFGGTLLNKLFVRGDISISMILSMNSRYLFANTQPRSFDLKDKRWGRYMEVYANIEAAEAAAAALSVNINAFGTPGINVFTQNMRVHPGFSNLMNLGFVFKNSFFHGELGYELFSRQAERVKLACCWQPGPALIAAVGSGETTKSRTINHNASGSDDVLLPNYAVLEASDLDIASAAHPSVVDHSLYVSGGFECNNENTRVTPFLTIGASYEFSSNNASIDRWLAWLKYGLMY